MPPAPWDGAAAEDQLFVLVTGANSGIGLGIGQRLIDEFAARYCSSSSSSSSGSENAAAHLVLIVTTRSAAKSRATVAALHDYLRATHGRRGLASALSSGARAAHVHIHITSLELDLCNLPSVHAAAARLAHEPLEVVSATAAAGSSSTTTAHARIPRLDSIVCNAGVGGWTGLNWGNLLKNVLTGGIVEATTFPTCKDAAPGLLVDPLTGRAVVAADGVPDGTLGYVFCANVFGHYVFVHALLPLLRRRPDGLAQLGPARIVWESSVEAVCWRYLSLDDVQGVRTHAAYESSKRLTDVLAITADLPGVAAYAAPFFEDAEEEEEDEEDEALPPATYVTHPGVVCSTLFPLHWILFYLYNLGMYVSRWLGSPWHPVTAYQGAAAAVWLVLQPQPALDALDARHVKWGAGTTRGGTSIVKRTEVEGWGWRGALGEEKDYQGVDPLRRAFPALAQSHYLRNSLGRRRDATPLTAERRQDFEVLGRDCWREMERLRLAWAARVEQARQAGTAPATAATKEVQSSPKKSSA